MTSGAVLAAVRSLEKIARNVGLPQLAAAYARCAEAPDVVLVVEFAALPATIRELVPDANCVPETELEAAPERALRAIRVLLVVPADDLLEAASLERIAKLLLRRPLNSVAVLLSETDKLPVENLPALERRAWRTLVPNPPGNPSRLSLAAFGVFLAGSAADSQLSERLLQDRSSLIAWLASPPPSAETFDHLALRVLNSQLEQELDKIDAARPTVAPKSAGRRKAQESYVMGRVLDRIDGAFDEVERTIETEARRLSQNTADAIDDAIARRVSPQQVDAAVAELRRSSELVVLTAIEQISADLAQGTIDDLLTMRSKAEIDAIIADNAERMIFAQPVKDIFGSQASAIAMPHGAQEPWRYSRTLLAGALGAALGFAIAAVFWAAAERAEPFSSALGDTISVAAERAEEVSAVLGAMVGVVVEGVSRMRRGAATPDSHQLAEYFARRMRDGLAETRRLLAEQRRRARKALVDAIGMAPAVPNSAPGPDQPLPDRRQLVLQIMSALNLDK